jgi:hypothetical protein
MLAADTLRSQARRPTPSARRGRGWSAGEAGAVQDAVRPIRDAAASDGATMHANPTPALPSPTLWIGPSTRITPMAESTGRWLPWAT